MGKSTNRKMVFKQFTVRDERCAMKIGTDAVALGVLASHSRPNNILDIGTGSGIVALMLAQRFPDAKVTAIELESEAYSQSQENFSDSPFANRLTAINERFQSWADSTAERFDLIVTNPPFFNSQSRSPIEARNMARHDDYLKVDEIFDGVNKVLGDGGKLVIVWPVERTQDLLKCASEKNFGVQEKVDILPTNDHAAVRFVATFIKDAAENHERKDLILEEGVGDERKFTPEYLSLVKDFFLKA